MNDVQQALAGLNGPEFAEAFLEIADEARNCGLSGFGGGCFAAAVGINRALFGGTGTLVAGLNARLWEAASDGIGHAAVQARGAYWDADGHPKAQDEIESWGMLDPEDSDHKNRFRDRGLEWDEEAAADGATYEFDDEQEFLEAFDCAEDADEAERIVADAAAGWHAARLSGPRAT